MIESKTLKIVFDTLFGTVPYAYGQINILKVQYKMSSIQLITTEELKTEIGKANTKIIDLRPIDAYNGWPLRGETKGGHIQGAHTLPIKWADYMDWIEIVRSKGFLPEHKIILYAYEEEDCYRVAKMFEKAGYSSIFIYPDFLKDWLTHEMDLITYLPRYKNLVPASWVKAFVDGKTPEGFEEKKTVIVHAHYRNRKAYLGGHIPGAIDMDTCALESPETWNRRTPEELKKALEDHGITANTRVILYGKFLWPDNEDEFPGSAAGHIGAIRCNLIMLYAGVKEVHVLNGGFQSWVDANYKISKVDVPKRAVKDFGAKIPARPELIVDIEEVKEMIAAEDAEIVSVRSWAEYIGETSGYNYIQPKGRIPGSVFGNCGSDAYHMENYRNVDHTIREADEVEEIWRAIGITSDKKLAFFCGTGWRGSEAFYNAYLMGWPKVAVYDGGWFEWSKDPNNPFETGIPK